MTAARKICMLGDFAVGKSSLVRRFVDNVFSNDYHATLGVNIMRRRQRFEIDRAPVEIDLMIWDIEGSRFGGELLNTYLKGAAGALVVGAIDREDAAPSMRAHAEMFEAVRPGRPFVFALNKCDLASDAHRPDPVEDMARAFHAPIMLTSAAQDIAVGALFASLARRIVELDT